MGFLKNNEFDIKKINDNLVEFKVLDERFDWNKDRGSAEIA